MSHEVKIHEAQTTILRELLFHTEARFAQLQKPTGFDADHFKFHIGRLVELGYVTKHANGKYSLTIKGKEHANKLDTDTHTIERQPKLSVGLIIENEKGEFLTQQRLKQPYFGFWGRPTGKIRWGETFLEALPETIINEQIDKIEEQERQNLVYRGQTWVEHLKEEGVTAEQHRDQKRPEAERGIKASLLLAEIADAEKLDVTPEELASRVEEMKARYSSDKAMQDELNKLENQRDIASRMLTEKAVAKLKKFATAN